MNESAHTPYYADDAVTLFHGDCLDVLRTLPDSSVDSVVTDPPYGLGFMGKAWDDLPPGVEWARECLRVLKPGGHLLAFGGSRTGHRLTCAVEDAGFEIRDSIAWLYGSGFPKSLDVSKAIDKAAGAEREVIGEGASFGAGSLRNRTRVEQGYRPTELNPQGGAATLTAPTTTDAARWQGWGTALKPAFEPIVVGRKPIRGTVAANVLAYGTGALNIDGCRVAHANDADLATSLAKNPGRVDVVTSNTYGAGRPQQSVNTDGRWPTNVVLDGSQADALDAQSGTLTSHGVMGSIGQGKGRADNASNIKSTGIVTSAFWDSGGASRFFPTFHYEAKAPALERPMFYTHSCKCEEPWPTHAPTPTPTTSPARATAATTSPASSSTSTIGSEPTDSASLTGTKSITSTRTKLTTTPPTYSPSHPRSTNASTPDVSSEMVSGGSPATSAVTSSSSDTTTGTSVVKDGRSTAGVAPVTLPAWSATSVCGSCGAPSKREAHATVKPLDLMRWLVRLVTPPGGTVLEPFAGSGTTAEACVIEGFKCIAIEREADYLPLIVQRLSKPIEIVLDFGGVA